MAGRYYAILPSLEGYQIEQATMVNAYLWLIINSHREKVLLPRLKKVSYTLESGVRKNEALGVENLISR